MSEKKLTTKSIRNFKKKNSAKFLQMLTCYDYPTARMFNETNIDLLLVGDSLGNVVLGYDSTIPVSLSEMVLFSNAVKRGAQNKFVVVDLPFGCTGTISTGVENGLKLFQKSKAEAIKIEGGFDFILKIISRLTQNGVPVMGHIGLRPQSVHQDGGFHFYGKNEKEKNRLLSEAINLEEAGCFAIVLECVDEEVAKMITEKINIPTIGIGSGKDVDGQVLVTNDLLKWGDHKIPKFCTPIADLFNSNKKLIEQYLENS